MAQGDVVFFDQFLVDRDEKLHDLENDVIQIALIDGTITPTAATADPRWGAGGTTNFLAEQVAIGGNYAGPVTLANNVVALTAGRSEIDWDDPATWATNASNPTDATWAIIFNNTDAGKRCIGFVDIGGAFNMTTGPLTITFGTPVAYTDQA